MRWRLWLLERVFLETIASCPVSFSRHNSDSRSPRWWSICRKVSPWQQTNCSTMMSKPYPWESDHKVEMSNNQVRDRHQKGWSRWCRTIQPCSRWCKTTRPCSRWCSRCSRTRVPTVVQLKGPQLLWPRHLSLVKFARLLRSCNFRQSFAHTMVWS